MSSELCSLKNLGMRRFREVLLLFIGILTNNNYLLEVYFRF